MDLVSRLIAFKESTGLTNSQFADTAEIPRPTLSQFINGRNKRLSDELISKLHTAYPQLNISWLLFGEGDMTNDPVQDDIQAINAAETIRAQPHILIDQVVTTDHPNASPDLKDMPAADAKSEVVDIDKAANEIAAKVMTSMLGGATPHPSKERKIKSIMVFYSDNSYETFTPQD